MRLQHGRCMLSLMKQPHLPLGFVHSPARIVAKWIFTLACQLAVGQQAATSTQATSTLALYGDVLKLNGNSEHCKHGSLGGATRWAAETATIDGCRSSCLGTLQCTHYMTGPSPRWGKPGDCLLYSGNCIEGVAYSGPAVYTYQINRQASATTTTTSTPTMTTTITHPTTATRPPSSRTTTSTTSTTTTSRRTTSTTRKTMTTTSTSSTTTRAPSSTTTTRTASSIITSRRTTTTTTLGLSSSRSHGTGSTTAATFSASTGPPIRHIQGQLGMMVSDAVDFVREANLTLVLRQGVAEVAEVPDDWVTILSVKLDSIDVDIRKRGLSAMQELDISWKIFIDPAAPEQFTAVIIRDRYDRKTINEVTQVINNIIDVLGANYVAEITWKTVDAWTTPTPDPDPSPTSDSGGKLVWVIIIAILLCFALVGLTVLCNLKKIMDARTHEPPLPNVARRPATQKNFERVAGNFAKCDFTEILKPPEQISRSDGEGILRLARAMVPPKGRSSELYLVFAVGHRPQDAEGFGPGMFYATAVLKYLHDHGVDCFCGLMFQHGIDNHDAFLAQLASPTSCKVLIVLQTKALYEDISSLEQLYVAQESGVEFLLVRVERDLPSAKDEWLNVSSADPLFSLAMLPVMLPNVRRKISTAKSMPHPPHAVLDAPDVLRDVSAHLRRMLGSEDERRSGTQCQPFCFAKSSTEVEAIVGPACVKPSTLGRSSSGACSPDQQSIEQTASAACSDLSKAKVHDVVADNRNQGSSREFDKVATLPERKRTGRSHSKQIASMQQGCASLTGSVGASRAPTSKHKPHGAPKNKTLVQATPVLRSDESLKGPPDARHRCTGAVLHNDNANRGQLGRTKKGHNRKEEQAPQFANSAIDASKLQPARAITATRDFVGALTSDHLASVSKNKRRGPSGYVTHVRHPLSASVVRDRSFDGAKSEPSSPRTGHNRRPQHGGVRRKKRILKTPHAPKGNQQ